MGQMKITPIRSSADYQVALKEVSRLMKLDPDVGTLDGDKLDILVTLIEAYELKHMDNGRTDPIAAILFRMDQSGLTVKDLAPLIGTTSRVYEVLNGTRPLSLRMIRNLNKKLGIPAQSLIGD
jgi:HTH-type transcriptional regulator/antitoxin HigA